MKMLKVSLVLTITVALAACTPEADSGDRAAPDQTALPGEASEPGTLVEVAQGDAGLSTFVSAVTAAGLDESLSGEGPFTVFAPSDDAFAMIPAETMSELTANDTKTLSNILQYHVVSGSLDAASVLQGVADAGDEGMVIETVGGGTLSASLVDGAIVLQDSAGGTARVSAANVEASNGLIHVIDWVLMPS